MHPALRPCSRLPLALLTSFTLTLALAAGCDCGGPVRPACSSSAECRTGFVCLDQRCQAATDAGPMDGGAPLDAADHDAFVAPIDSSFDAACIPVTCAADEVCFDGIDEDCDDIVDENCGCVPGSTARCLPGRPDPTTPRCSWGEMTCEGSGEFGQWGACTGSGVDGGTSTYGCRRIGIMGAQGANPSSNFQGWLEMQGAIATRFHDTAAAPTLRRDELETFDLVVVDWLQRTYSVEESDTLASWVREGGGLLVMTGHDSGATADRHVSLLVSLGPTYDLAAGPISGPAVLVLHPTTLDTDGVSVLPPVSFFGGLRVVVPPALSADVVTMAVIGSDVVGVAGPIGDGRVLLFGDEWIEFDSEWSTMPPILRFWQNAVSWLAPDEAVLPACPE